MPAQPLDFYSVTATVIPVLFIALAFETRAFGRHDAPPEKDLLLAGIRLYAFFLILWGEGQAVHVLSTGRPTDRAHDAVTAALITEAVLLAFSPAVAFLRAGVGTLPDRYQRYVVPTLRALLITAGLALLVLGVLQFAHGN